MIEGLFSDSNDTLRLRVIAVNEDLISKIEKFASGNDCDKDFDRLINDVKSLIVLIHWKCDGKLEASIKLKNDLISLCCSSLLDFYCCKEQKIGSLSEAEIKHCVHVCFYFLGGDLAYILDVLLYSEKLSKQNKGLISVFLKKVASNLKTVFKITEELFLKIFAFYQRYLNAFGCDEFENDLKVRLIKIGMPQNLQTWFASNGFDFNSKSIQDMLKDYSWEHCSLWLDIFAKKMLITSKHTVSNEENDHGFFVDTNADNATFQVENDAFVEKEIISEATFTRIVEKPDDASQSDIVEPVLESGRILVSDMGTTESVIKHGEKGDLLTVKDGKDEFDLPQIESSQQIVVDRKTIDQQENLSRSNYSLRRKHEANADEDSERTFSGELKRIKSKPPLLSSHTAKGNLPKRSRVIVDPTVLDTVDQKVHKPPPRPSSASSISRRSTRKQSNSEDIVAPPPSSYLPVNKRRSSKRLNSTDTVDSQATDDVGPLNLNKAPLSSSVRAASKRSSVKRSNVDDIVDPNSNEHLPSLSVVVTKLSPTEEPNDADDIVDPELTKLKKLTPSSTRASKRSAVKKLSNASDIVDANVAASPVRISKRSTALKRPNVDSNTSLDTVDPKQSGKEAKNSESASMTSSRYETRSKSKRNV